MSVVWATTIDPVVRVLPVAGPLAHVLQERLERLPPGVQLEPVPPAALPYAAPGGVGLLPFLVRRVRGHGVPAAPPGDDR